MILRLLLILCFTANAAIVLAQDALNKTLVVGSEEDFPPFAIGKTDGTASGFTVDLWKEVAKEAGLKYSIRVKPWGQILQEFKDGKIDVLINVAQSEDRGKYTDFSVPHVKVHGAIFVRKDESRIQSEADLDGKSIIVLKSDLAHEYAVSKGWQKQLSFVNTAQEGLRLLASGQHDVMLLSKLTGMQLLKVSGIKNIKALDSKAGYAQKFSFGVHKGDAELLAKLNEGLALTKSSDSYNALYTKWFGMYEEKKIGFKDALPYILPFLFVSLLVGSYNFLKRRIERNQALKSLHLSKFSIDHSSDGIFWMTPDARIVDVNEAACRSLGYSRDELLNLSIPDFDNSYVADVWAQHFAELRQLGSQKVETVHIRKDGSQFPVEIVANYLQYGHDERVCGFVRNITERKQAEANLLQSEKQFRLAIEEAPFPIMMHADDGEVLAINNAWTEISGYVFADIPNIDAWTELAYGVRKQSVIEDIKSLYSLGSRKNEGEYEIVCKDGSKRIWDFSSVSLGSLPDGRRTALSMASDVTFRKKSEEEKLTLEQQIQHTQKLESLGVLAGGIAHDFNNILAIIIGYCSLTKMDYETAASNIPEIEKAAERAAGLCRQMLAYAGKALLSMTQVNMSIVVDEMVSMLKSTLPKNAEIIPNLPTDIPTIFGDPSQVRQVIMNLIINASEAIGDVRGEIRVSLAATSIQTGQSENDYNGTTIPPGAYVCIEVTDNGSGMDEETQRRIFEPFYSTKFTGRGLGMSAVLGIIKSHGGAMQLHTKLGEGTTFRIYLPAISNQSTGDENQTQPSASTKWQGSGTILLVEDEDKVRLIAKALLSNFGFTVLEAVNGKEALELYQANATDITLVMTDMGMPIMDGYELFYELKKLNPQLPIIVSSGYGDAEVSSRISIDDIAGLVSKPYSSDQLRDALKRALGVNPR
jgi:PAS domain S-box-containing protein